ncbi:hypothetical protein EBB05_12020 [Methylobacterium brachiatum]|nr:hypothetical protein EBB05_12020 [Methylobacterium brachiatum]
MRCRRRGRPRNAPSPKRLADPRIAWPGAGPLSRAGEGQGEGCDVSGKTWSLTPTLSRTGEGVSASCDRRLIVSRPLTLTR